MPKADVHLTSRPTPSGECDDGFTQEMPGEPPATGLFGDGASGTFPADAPLRVLELSGRRP